MKGKKIFTKDEINEIKSLIKEKLKAPQNKQKGIREKIRCKGFYWEDFHPRTESPKVEYNIENFERLISQGDIVINND